MEAYETTTHFVFAVYDPTNGLLIYVLFALFVFSILFVFRTFISLFNG